MKVIEPGHKYYLQSRLGVEVPMTFYKDPDIHGTGHDGVLCQEVIRVLIDRVKTLETEKPAPENEVILYHLRMAIVGFELRALRLSVEKGEPIEKVAVGPKGHIHK